MTRRNTIIVAVLVNAVLLTLLFVTAVTHDDENYVQTQLVMDKEEKPIDLSLLNEPKVIQPVVASASVPIPLAAMPSAQDPLANVVKALEAPVLPAPAGSSSPVDDKIVHKFPEPVVQIPVEAAPVALPKQPKYQEVVVKKGDSLEKIAKAQKVSLDELVKLNNLPNSFLRIGQVLKIPEQTATLAKAVDNKPKEIPSSQYYIVKAGDNPWTIAMKHHIKVEELLRLNHMDKEKAKRLKPGDKLRIR